jgi:hypothetical protein
MDLGEVGWVGVDWIGLTQDRNRWRAVVNLVINTRIKCSETVEQILVHNWWPLE